MKESIRLKFGEEIVVAQIDRAKKWVLLPGNPKDYKDRWGTVDEFTEEIRRTNQILFENYDGCEFPTFGPIRAYEIDDCYIVESITRTPIERYIAVLESIKFTCIKPDRDDR